MDGGNRFEQTYQIVQNNYTGNEFGKMEWDAAKRKMELSKDLVYKISVCLFLSLSHSVIKSDHLGS